MFTGIVETMGQIVDVRNNGLNKTFVIRTEIFAELKVDQSISHNGVCLTVEKLSQEDQTYEVSAILETLGKTTLDGWRKGDFVNLERSITIDQRLDGHLVQGHVDGILTCLEALDQNGSTYFTFALPEHERHLVIPQGSITLDGMSLTVAGLDDTSLAVAIIPFTFEHTVAKYWQAGSKVNVEYDVFGKYLARYRELFAGSFLPIN